MSTELKKGRKSGRTYIVAGSKAWNRRVFDEVISRYPGKWYFFDSPEQLTIKYVKQLNPRYLFFPHWSWKVPMEIVNGYECVCFHMTDVPYGRGGSPLQNLIIRGHKQTKLTALKMVDEMDAGPIYLKEDFWIESGSAEEIYLRATYQVAAMIERIITEQITPVPQKEKPVIFKRRRPEESEIPDLKDLMQLYDFIRMLDADGYPRAFINDQGFHYAFSRAVLYNGQIKCDVTISPTKEDTP